MPPTKQPIAGLLKHYLSMGKKHGVTYKCGEEVTSEMIKAENPDAVVLATGGCPIIPKIDGVTNENVVTALDILSGKKVAGKNVLVIGGGSVGVETADFLAENLRNVTVVEMRDEVAIDEPNYPKIFLMERLRIYNVNILTSAMVTGILPNGITYKKSDEELKLEGFDTIVLALGVRSYNPLEESLKNLDLEVHVIGDALKAGDAVDAILEGAQLAINI